MIAEDGGEVPVQLDAAVPRSGRAMLVQEKTTKKGPYTQYGALESEGVSITWGDPADPAALPDGPFDVVYDNNGKTLDVCQPAIDAFKVRFTGCSVRRGQVGETTGSIHCRSQQVANKGAL